jgi:selenocysteine lyase/cysteine desulfurase
LESLLNDRTRLVAVNYASNAVGTITDVKKVAELAHRHGALVYVDAVHFTPHGVVDVQAIDCDFLACSVYKFFGPHTGVLYGKHELLDQLNAYKVRPASNDPPGNGKQARRALKVWPAWSKRSIIWPQSAVKMGTAVTGSSEP